MIRAALADPETPEQWQSCVDAAHALLALDGARQYGLITGDLFVGIAGRVTRLQGIRVGRVYAARRPRRGPGGVPNDRRVTAFDGQTVQFETPATADANAPRPRVPLGRFLAWADRDVTDECGPDRWRPPAET